MRNWKLLLTLATLLPALTAQRLWSQNSQEAAKKTAAVRFSPDMLDKDIDPCNDFYRLSPAASGWQPIPSLPTVRVGGASTNLQSAGNTSFATFSKRPQSIVPAAAANEQKIGDYYASCMDEVRHRESRHQAPRRRPPKHCRLEFESRICRKEIVRLHREGSDVLFGFGSGSDFKNSSQVIGELDQGGLGLPDRDYYVKDDAKSVELREKYVAHMQKMFQLLGDDQAKAASEAKVIMDIETGLAKGALDQTSRRDPQKIYHKLSTQELAAINNGFDWNFYFEGVGAPRFDSLNVVDPEFVKQMKSVLDAHSLDDWKTYLRWHVVLSNALRCCLRRSSTKILISSAKRS